VRKKGESTEFQSFVTIDKTPPDQPLILDISHTSGRCKVNPSIEINYENNGNEQLTYAILWDHQPETSEFSNTVTTTTISMHLDEGNDHYCHIKAKDRAFNFSETIHLGPFCVSALQDKHKAIIVSAYNLNNMDNQDLGIKKCGELAKKALIAQGYKEETSLKYLSPENHMNLNSLDVKEILASNWCKESTHLIIYAVGHANQVQWTINQDILTHKILVDNLLELQKNGPDTLVFIFESCYSGCLINAAKDKPIDGNKKRIIITSTDGETKAHMKEDITQTFSYPFWQTIESGNCLSDAYYRGRKGVYENHDGRQLAQVDANIDGITNDKIDLQILNTMSIGIIDSCVGESASGPETIDAGDDFHNACLLVVNTPQNHYFHSVNDVDMFCFMTAVSDGEVQYEIQISHTGTHCDPQIELLKMKDFPIEIIDFRIENKGEELIHVFPKENAFYYVKISNQFSSSIVSPENTGYQIKFEDPSIQSNGSIIGFVKATDASVPTYAELYLKDNDKELPDYWLPFSISKDGKLAGYRHDSIQEGFYKIYVKSSGYKVLTTPTIDIKSEFQQQYDVVLSPSGLAEAIAILEVIAGVKHDALLSVYQYNLKEAIAILKKMSD